MKKEERIKQIKPLWELGKGISEISREINLPTSNVSRYLDIIYGKRREKRHIYKRRIFTLEEDFFEIINSEEKAYFLGLIFADGNLSKGQNLFRISLHEKDREILEIFRKSLNYTRPLKLIKKSKKDWNRSNQYLLAISSTTFRKSLHKYGLIPDKSTSIKFPRNIEKEFLSHFIRGYFDGDGCIYIDKNISKPMGIFAGSKSFCLTLVDILGENNIIGRFSKHSSSNCYYTRITSKEEVYKLYNFLYNNSTMFLKRKKHKFDIWISKRIKQ